MKKANFTRNRYLGFAVASLVTLGGLTSAFAEATTYNVKGMHCGACAKMIESKVCKMDGIAACEVTMGKMVLTPKEGVHLTQDQVQKVLSTAGDEYVITGQAAATKAKK